MAGEHMTEKELTEALLTLVGCSEEGGNTGESETDPNHFVSLSGLLTGPISCVNFTNDLLGLHLYNE